MCCIKANFVVDGGQFSDPLMTDIFVRMNDTYNQYLSPLQHVLICVYFLRNYQKFSNFKVLSMFRFTVCIMFQEITTAQ